MPAAPVRTLLNRARGLASGPVARGAISSLAIRMAGIGLSFAQGVLTARLLGPAGYGAVAIVLSVAQIAATLALFGLGPLAVREVAAARAAGDDARVSAFVRFAVLATMAFSMIATAALCLAAGEDRLLALAALAVPLLALIQLARGLAQGLGAIAAAQWPGEILRPLALVGLLMAGLFAGGLSPAGFMACLLAASLLALVAGGVAVWRRLPGGNRPTARMLPRRWLADAAPFLGMALASLLVAELNTLLLGWLAGAEQAGLFQPVARIATLLSLPAQAAGMAYAPRVAALWRAGDMAALRRLTATYVWTTTVITGAAALVLALLGPWVLAVFGPDFVPGAGLLWQFGLAYAFSAACGPLGILLAMTGRTGLAVLGQSAGIAANLAVGLLLIPHQGAAGAASAAVAALVVWNLVLVVVVRRKLGFDPTLLSALR